MAKLFSENAQTVLSFLQSNAGDFTADMIADETGLVGAKTKGSVVNGIVTGLAKKGYVERVEVEGIEKKVIRLTADGASVDPNADKPE